MSSTRGSMRGDDVSTHTFRRAIDEHEAVRRGAARRLHGTLQSKLTACHLWLGMVEDMLSETNRDDGDEDVEHAVARARPLLSKVRDELDRMRKTDVRAIEHTLYPGLIHVGLRAALESWADMHELSLAVEFQFEEPFVRWDRPTTDGRIIQVRLELFRLIEAVTAALDDVVQTFISAEKQPGSALLNVRLVVDLAAGPECVPNDGTGVHVTLALIGRGEAGFVGQLTEAMSRSHVPLERFARAGGQVWIGEPPDAASATSARAKGPPLMVARIAVTGASP